MQNAFKSFGSALWTALKDIWCTVWVIFPWLWGHIARWPAGIKRWWTGIFERERIRRTGRFYYVAVWVREEGEDSMSWITHYYNDPDLKYVGLTHAEAEQLGDEALSDATDLGLEVQVKTEFDRAYV